MIYIFKQSGEIEINGKKIEVTAWLEINKMIEI